MKVSTAKTEIICLSRHPVQCSLQTNGVTLKQTKKLKYLGVTFSRDGRQDNELDTHIKKASAEMRQPYRLVVLKRELCTKAKLSIFRLYFVPIPIYGHECWVMTERMRFRVQAAEMGSCKKSEVYPYLTRLDICQSLNIELLLLCIEQTQVRWYGHVILMSYDRTAKQLMDALSSDKRPRGRPSTHWQNYIEDQARLSLQSPMCSKIN